MKIFQKLLMALTLLIVPYVVHAGIDVQSIEVKHFTSGSTPMTALKIKYVYNYNVSEDYKSFDAGYSSGDFGSLQFYFGISLIMNGTYLLCQDQSTVGIASSPFSGVPTQRCIPHRSNAIRDTIMKQYLSSNSGGTIQIVTNGYKSGNVCAIASAVSPSAVFLSGSTTFKCVSVAAPDANCNIVEPIVLDHGTVSMPGTAGNLVIEKTVSLNCDYDANVTISDNAGVAKNLKLGEGIISTVTLNSSSFPVKLSAKAKQNVPLLFKSSLSIDPSVQSGSYENFMILTINYQ